MLMKTIFIQAKHNEKISLPEDLIRKLPKEVALFTTVQFIGSIKDIKKQLEKKGINVKLLKTKHSKYTAQILGCNVEKFKAENFLYIGDGMFHPKALLLKNNARVFVYNPFTKKHFELSKKDAEDMIKKQKAGLVKFLYSKEIGVLISTKPGQNKLKEARALKKKYPEKNFYFLIFNTLDFTQLENFNFIECFVNTACPRISYDDSEKIRKPMVNIDDLQELK
jgi:2-(3-amino-3-carboxypropyl)histidine synthase